MKYQNIIDNMTLKEKAAFLSGKSEWQTRDFPRLDIPAIFCSDGPNGVRKQAGAGDHLGINPAVPATCFPTAAAMANSWDEELEQRVGVALGEESMEEDVNVLLGPGLNIKRNPLCGRNFEYFSEDPYLSGKMAAAFIRGVQSTGAAACAKHFAVNSQELRRMAMNAVVDERTLREIYLTGFEIAIKEGGAKTVMSSYNEVNGVYANENEHLLKDILRDEWGFEGSVITDKALHEEHHKLARLACENSAVLLKNEDGILPVGAKVQAAIIGDFAFDPRYQGAGSSMVNSTKVDSIKDMLETSGISVTGIVRGYQRDGKEDEAMKKEAVDLARRSDVVLFFFGLNEKSETEGLDRKHLRIPQNQINLIQELAKANANMIGIISAGSVIEMPWHHHFKALLHTALMGQAGAGAVLDILSGKVNPSGKLAETYIKKYEDTPSYNYYPSQERNSEYREGIYVGYRYFDTAGVPVNYPFGYGLSYTTFEYGNLQVKPDSVTFTLRNTGKYDGAEIAQLYVGLPGAKVFRPVKELKGFSKVFLKLSYTTFEYGCNLYP